MRFFRQSLTAFSVVLLLFFVAACDSDDNGITDPPVDPPEEEFPRVEIETRGLDAPTIAVWTPSGWADADGNATSELEDPIETSDGTRQALQVGGQNASLTVRIFDEDGNDIEVATEDRTEFDTLLGGANRERECTSALGDGVGADFNIVNGEDLISWPAVAHPDGFGDAQFALGKDGTYPAIFHCDHVHFYPENEGTFEVEFGTQDGSITTDPIAVSIGPNQETIGRAEISTRGLDRPTIAVWTPEDGWTDGEGSTLNTLPDPIEDGAGDRFPLREGSGVNASLTVAFFDADGNEYQIETEGREDFATSEPGVSRERTCSPLNSRFAIEGGTSLIPWPSQAHPDGFGATHFAQWAAEGEEWIANFHCDHIHFYPEQEGTFEVEFALFSEGEGRNVAYTDPIGVEILAEEN